MKINLKGEGIEYNIEMGAEELKISNQSMTELIKLILDKRYEIMSFIKEIKKLENHNTEEEKVGE